METVLLDLVDPPKWWLRIGLEKGGPVSGCPEQGCDTSALTTVDLYCETHGRFLPAARVIPSKLVAAAINIARVAVCAAFVLAAQIKTSLPLFLVGALVAAVVLLPPLRLYPIALRWALACWALVTVLTLIFSWTSLTAQRIAVLTLLIVLMVITAVHLGPLAAKSSSQALVEGSGVRSVTARVRGYVAASAAILPVALTGWLALVLLQMAWPIDTGRIRDFLLTTAIATIAVAGLTAIVFGILFSGNTVDFSFRRPVGPPRKPSALTWSLARWRPKQISDRDLADRVSRDVTMLLFQVAQALVLLARSAVQFARLLLYAAVYLLSTGVNAILSVMLWAALWIASVLVGAAQSLRGAVRVLNRAIPHTLRVVVLPVVFMAYAAALTLFWSRRTYAYLVDGTAWALAESLLAAASAVVLLTATWTALSGLPVRATTRSATRTLAIFGANALVLLAVGGWAVGLAGTFGRGEIRVGPVTIVASVILLTAWLWSRRRSAPGSEGS
ncbi:hypothetical protein [Phytohabitans rumicis]|uniref:Uncharacterized protein n=1 Tax=Phytohabitans rumicis TaxID=1076125 RepID=A0A6V8LHI8_9ACTN|nr:hypothetical protein [Phytohabitans rumicis]GFJ93576.1 hypothetical protein Prum_072180 [Phytohabitans rumicis]